MSKVIILSSSETTKSISPHVANMMELNRSLGYDICLHNEKMIEDMLGKGEYESIIFTYGTGREYTSTAVPAIQDMVYRTGIRPRLYYMKNEYNIGENHILWALCRDEGYEYEMITNNTIEAESRCKRFWSSWHIVNIQNLVLKGEGFTAWEDCKPPPSLFPENNNYGLKEHKLLYYGSYRKEREKYFKYWLDKRFRVSTSKKNFPRYLGCSDVWLTLPLQSREELVKFKYTLYMEDMVSTKHFTHLANRFYECLEYDVIMFFDAICQNTIDKDVYPIDPWFMVEDKDELHEKIKFLESGVGKFMEKLELQRVNYKTAQDEKKKTIKQINDILIAYRP